MIICGFAGIGKSTLCRKNPKWIDLESTPFEKNFKRYAKVAQHMDEQGYNVMLSCHADLRKTLHKMGVDYTLVIPIKDLKHEYIRRYQERGNTESFIKSMDENWDNYTTAYHWEDVVHLIYEDQYLSDVIYRL